MTQEEFETRILDMQGMLYRVSSTLLPQLCQREDAIQEALYKALTKRDKLRNEAAVQSWVVRILINECYTILRKQKREEPVDELPEMQIEPGADLGLRQMLLSLEPALRLPTVLCYVEGYSVREVARMLRIPPGTVKSRLARARKKLRAEFEEGEAVRI